MKLTIIGAAGVWTSLIIDEIINRQDRIGITELCLMDIDAEHLDLIAGVTAAGVFQPAALFDHSHHRPYPGIIRLRLCDHHFSGWVGSNPGKLMHVFLWSWG